MNYLVSDLEGGVGDVLAVQRRRELERSTFVDCWFDERNGCAGESA